jgi:uncharacterized protein YjbI with pentapeptide repeats
MVGVDASDQVPAPSWPTCKRRSGETGSPCIGWQVEGFDRCLAHLEPEQLDEALQRLGPGANLVAPGTDINAELLERILTAAATEDGPPTFSAVYLAQAHFIDDASFTWELIISPYNGVQFNGTTDFSFSVFDHEALFIGAKFGGDAHFGGAKFGGDAHFGGVQFGGNAEFGGARFGGDAHFGAAEFSGNAKFRLAKFSGNTQFPGVKFCNEADFSHAEFKYAEFNGAKFGGYAAFGGTKYSEYAGFHGAQFCWDAYFYGAQFGGSAKFGRAQFSRRVYRSVNFSDAQFADDADFAGAQFSPSAQFTNSRFEKATSLGPLAAGDVEFQRAVFVCPVVLEAAAVTVACNDVTWETGVTMRLRYAQVDLEGATFTEPSFVVGADQPFVLPDSGRVDEGEVIKNVQAARPISDDSWVPVLSSLRGVDAFHLSVTDVDLSRCRFAGARLLDQLRLEGRCVFDRPPKGLHAGWAWPPLWRWSNRQSLAEERIWRATTPKFPSWAGTRSSEPAEVRPERLAGLYRQLRKAQEDAKNEPGAADFYYGEMEMRRHARTTPAAERSIVWLYWLISGYGLRALRSLAALAILGVIVTTTLIGWGLAATTPPQHLTGTITTAPHKAARIDATLGVTTPQIPLANQRWTTERTRTALEVTLESIVFRSTDQPLTAIGIWTTDAARILGPVLLALALLAARNRVKR